MWEKNTITNMARRKYKLTGFAKFFIVMLFLAPIAYFAAVYINEGEEGLNAIFQGDDNTTTRTVTEKKDNDLRSLSLEEENQMLRDSIRRLNLEYNELKRQYRLLEDNQ